MCVFLLLNIFKSVGVLSLSLREAKLLSLVNWNFINTIRCREETRMTQRAVELASHTVCAGGPNLNEKRKETREVSFAFGLPFNCIDSSSCDGASFVSFLLLLVCLLQVFLRLHHGNLLFVLFVVD